MPPVPKEEPAVETVWWLVTVEIGRMVRAERDTIFYE
jgi:hypothetical protein